jgi:outer membrane protein TolC
MKHRLHVLVLAAAACWLGGCTPAQYARQADVTADATISAGQMIALGARQRPFEVIYDPLPVTEVATMPGATQPASAPSGPVRVIRLGEKLIPIGAGQPQKLTAEDCLQIAFRNSRSFQARKEQLFTDALALANSRRDWIAHPSGSLEADATRTVVQGQGDTNSANAAAILSLSRRLRDGGLLSLAAGVNLASDLLGSRSTAIDSLLTANFTQPLLRGAWRGLAYEPQYRLERNFVYSVYDYERFTQTFAADAVNRYYALVQSRDQIKNQRDNIARLEQTVRTTEVLFKGEVVSRIELDQAESNLLDAKVVLEDQTRGYAQELDSFKISLGLPVSASIEVDYPGALEAMSELGPQEVPVTESDAIVVAMSTRPDVLTQSAQVRDALRDVEIAADQFNPQLDVVLGVSVPSQGPRDFWDARFDRHTRLANAKFQYDLDQTDHRDAYRVSLLAAASARRNYDEFIDTVQLDVRRAYRQLHQSRVTYELQERNVQIAQRRSRLANLQLKEGLAAARDALEAEESLRTARNSLSGALVSYYSTRLAFLAKLGMLWVDEKGLLHERTEPFDFARIQRQYPQTAPAGQ